MKGEDIQRLFKRLSNAGSSFEGAAFAALSLPGSVGHMVALSSQGRPSLLIRTTAEKPRPANIHLTGVSAFFDVACTVSMGEAPAEECRVSYLECTAGTEAVPVFAEAAAILLRQLGPHPTMAETASAIARFAAVFSALSKPSRQSVSGLIGELMMLMMCTDPVAAVARWRVASTDLFDFVGDDARVEVKAFSSTLRMHSFSWEQCNIPDGHSLLASLRVEAAGGGTSVGELLDRLETRLAANPEAAIRLRETVAMTMGSSLAQALRVTFDETVCRASLLWFDLREVPAIRGELPEGVGSLRFTSDVSETATVAPALLLGTSMACLVPQ